MVYVYDDKSLSVENESFFDVEVDWMPENVHAVQWYGDEVGGEIEFKPEGNIFGQKPPNEKITELGDWERLVTIFYEEKQKRLDAELAAQEAAEAARDHWQEFRGIRDGLLSQSDWTQLSDVSSTEEQKIAWTIYRQELRDLPENITDPKPMVLAYYDGEIHPDWPVAPQ
jgi:hypothetical protein